MDEPSSDHHHRRRRGDVTPPGVDRVPLDLQRQQVLLDTATASPATASPLPLSPHGAASARKLHQHHGSNSRAIRTPPPGFYYSSHASSGGGGGGGGESTRVGVPLGGADSVAEEGGGAGGDRHAEYYAEGLRLASLSAPPPPGFGLSADQRDSSVASSEDGSGKRTTSFANLAAALGEGLAECMDDSFNEAAQQQQQQSKGLLRPRHADERPQQENGRGGTDLREAEKRAALEQERQRQQQSSLSRAAAASQNVSSFTADGNVDTFARQSRHAASRLIGSSTAEARSSIMHGSGGFDYKNPAATVKHLRPPLTDFLVPGDVVPSSSSVEQSGVGENVSTSPLPPAGRVGSIIPQQQRTTLVGSLQEPLNPVGTTVVEPSNSPAGAGALNPPTNIAGLTLRAAKTDDRTQDEGGTNAESGGDADWGTGGRSSAPPQVYDAPLSAMQSDRGSSSAAIRAITASSLQQRAAELQHEFLPPRATACSATITTTTKGGMLFPTVASRDRTPEPAPSASSGADSRRQIQQVALERVSEEELAPFLRDVMEKPRQTRDGAPPPPSRPSPHPSRGLAILRAASLHIPDVRSTCEAFGALDSFRFEFCDTRGVIFITYHDLRSAQYAALELPACLRQLRAGSVEPSPAHAQWDVVVKYCVPLNSSSVNDESTIMLSNLPGDVDEQALSEMLTSYGAVRAIHYQASNEASDPDRTSYLVEFFDVQDARQALLELESTEPWGDDVNVKFGVRNPTKRKQGRDFLVLISRWRQGGTSSGSHLDSARSSLSGSPAVSSSAQTPVASVSPLPVVAVLPSASAEFAPSKLSQGTESTADSSTTFSPKQQAPEVTAISGSITVPKASPSPDGSESKTITYVASSEGHQRVANPAHSGAPMDAPQHTTQLVLGPDGRYSYVVVNHAGHAVHPVSAPQPPFIHHVDPQTGRISVDPRHQAQQHFVHGPHGTYISSYPATHVDHQHYYPSPHPLHAIQAQQYHQLPHGVVMATSPYPGVRHGYGPPAMPMYAPVQSGATSSTPPESSVSSGGSSQRKGKGGEKTDKRSASSPSGSASNQASSLATGSSDDDTTQLALNIDAVQSGKDTRTSLMVRNIPNKYTQRMLLSEFAEGGHGPDKIDFFYLPIDFKNKCNRGYAFVNFVDYRDIVPFHRRYNGKNWRVFNSDKRCDITYARIQGKAGMLKRFENSALMDKDDEYRPLVFVSHGANKGQREQFPSSGASS